jgi:site-specific DNA-methyltransferase (adenine-specific)
MLASASFLEAPRSLTSMTSEACAPAAVPSSSSAPLSAPFVPLAPDIQPPTCSLSAPMASSLQQEQLHTSAPPHMPLPRTNPAPWSPPITLATVAPAHLAVPIATAAPVPLDGVHAWAPGNALPAATGQQRPAYASAPSAPAATLPAPQSRVGAAAAADGAGGARRGPTQPVELKHGDCIDGMAALPPSSIDLLIADPPYNIAVQGSAWDTVPDYMAWSRRWLAESARVLRPGGALFIYGSPAKLWICHLKLLAAELGLEFKQHISWVYKQGGDSRLKGMTAYSVRMEHLEWFVKPGAAHTFNADAAAEPYTEAEFAEALAKGVGRVTPESLSKGRPPRNWWEIPRENSRSKERAYGLHPSMKPLKICERLVEVHSRRGESVLIPFGGSGSECVAAAGADRKVIAFENDREYYQLILRRMHGHGLLPAHIPPPLPLKEVCVEPEPSMEDGSAGASSFASQLPLLRDARNTSGYMGVYKHGKKWVAKVMRNGALRPLGTFNTPREAAAAYAQECAVRGDAERPGGRKAPPVPAPVPPVPAPAPAPAPAPVPVRTCVPAAAPGQGDISGAAAQQLIHDSVSPTTDIDSLEMLWVQCDRCQKWRVLPSGTPVSEDDSWFCEMHPVASLASCDVAEAVEGADGEEEVFLVEAVVGERQTAAGQREYEVKWSGHEETTWEPEENLASNVALLHWQTKKEAPAESAGDVASSSATQPCGMEQSTVGPPAALGNGARVGWRPKPTGRPPKGMNGLPKRWCAQSGQWVEDGSETAAAAAIDPSVVATSTAAHPDATPPSASAAEADEDEAPLVEDARGEHSHSMAVDAEGCDSGTSCLAATVDAVHVPATANVDIGTCNSGNGAGAAPMASVYGKGIVGQRIEIYWPLDDVWYPCAVLRYLEGVREHEVRYTDDEVVEQLDLQNEKWRMAGAGSASLSKAQSEELFRAIEEARRSAVDVHKTVHGWSVAWRLRPTGASTRGDLTVIDPNDQQKLHSVVAIQRKLALVAEERPTMKQRGTVSATATATTKAPSKRDLAARTPPRRELPTRSDEAGGDASAHCPSGHSLSCQMAMDGALSCDGCRSTILKHSSVWSCASCDYDLCDECAGAKVSSAPAAKRPRPLT